MADVLSALRSARLLSALDVQVARGLARLVGETRADAVLAAAVVSRATRSGHVCLDLTRAETFATDEAGTPHVTLPALGAWLDVLASSKLVGDGARGDTPLVLEGDRLYLRRYHAYERRLAEALARRVAHVESDVDGALLKGGLDRLFGAPSNDERDLQRLAALVAVARRFCIISGGPGTGKTTTVTKILALLQEQAVAQRKRGLQILLVAPTGKAAGRLRESIEKARGELDVEPRIRDLVPSDATTIHRRLSPIPGSTTKFRHDAQNQLPCDVLLVDEASMIDLPLMTHLVEALPSHAKLILLGDRNQLASVETGAILGELCGAAVEPSFSRGFAKRIFELVGEDVPVRAEPDAGGSGALADCVVQLEKSWRYGDESGIRALALAVNAGDGDEAVRLLTSGDYPDIALLPGPTEKGPLGPTLRAHAVAGYAPYLAERSPVAAAQAFDRYRVLCAHRRGPSGVESLNPQIEAALAASHDAGVGARLRLSPRTPWYDHRPVLVLENDYVVTLFNGDIGHALRADSGALTVHFVSADGTTRPLAPSRLPRHETVWAMTVHKAQGSEFDTLAFVLPPTPTRILTRELIYTAVTRAKKAVVTFGDSNVVKTAIGQSIERSSGLRSRLARMENATA